MIEKPDLMLHTVICKELIVFTVNFVHFFLFSKKNKRRNYPLPKGAVAGFLYPFSPAPRSGSFGTEEHPLRHRGATPSPVPDKGVGYGILTM